MNNPGRENQRFETFGEPEVNVRPKNEFVYIPHENIRDRPYEQFSDNASAIGYSQFTLSPSAIMKDIVPSPYASPLGRNYRQFEYTRSDVNMNNPFQKEPFPLLNSKQHGRLVDMFLNQDPAHRYPPNILETPNVPFPKFESKMISRADDFPEEKEEQDSNAASEKDDLSEDLNQVDKKKLTKGLKILSVVVRDIVNERQSTTYKEVADLILKDSMNLDQMSMTQKSVIAREEQNIKRRVYDALNVLISAGILIKEGKRVMKNEKTHKIKINLKRTEINTVTSKIVT